ncbi:hypothetical protein P7K49_035837 [Saguinus oedipus]|uniref:Uncharacterized protein n=1 Tax=Saguinus oedipus TaxID=9490 RepID=A0ABQ9TNR8_SAGOE|nr:hypothetical protein P7K49_035837 [Saguinus oedipus]
MRAMESSQPPRGSQQKRSQNIYSACPRRARGADAAGEERKESAVSGKAGSQGFPIGERGGGGRVRSGGGGGGAGESGDEAGERWGWSLGHRFTPPSLFPRQWAPLSPALLQPRPDWAAPALGGTRMQLPALPL